MTWNDPNADRRVKRTRHNVIDAFADLARERPYDEIRVGDVIAGAAVGRSTFYAHYRGKDDVLTQALSMFYEMLADAFAAAVAPPRESRPAPGMSLEAMLAHFRENHVLVRRLTTGPAAEAFAKSLGAFSALVADRLACVYDERACTPRIPLLLSATALAHGSMAMILSWVRRRPETDCSAAELADALRAFARDTDAGRRGPGV